MMTKIKRETDDTNVYYTVTWSRLMKVDKYDIINKVPSMAGMMELYFMDEKKKLVKFHFCRTWLSGIRATLRMITDPDLITNEDQKKILREKECYFRYSVSDSDGDMQDLLFFFSELFYEGKSVLKDSGRFRKIFVKEKSADKIITI
ncbi:MAG: hypothetical protein E4H36_04725 [Spirochaetales bacterium]|nr:MAG: hypothetical protein E4H36_04725 [Spirochaetales bacterium]